MSLNNFKFFLLVVVSTIIVYYFQHIKSAEFVYEDINWIGSHDWSLNDLSVIPGNRLTILTFAFNNSPKAAHSINLFIHIMNGLLLSLLVEHWFYDFGWITGSLFLVNPLTTQAVAYASGRGELLSLMFLFGFLWFATVSDLNFRTCWIFILICLLGMATTKATTLIVAVPLLVWVYYNDTSVSLVSQMEHLVILFLLSLPIVLYKYSAILKSSISIVRWFSIQLYASWRLFYEAIIGRGLAIDHPWWLASYNSLIVSIICGAIIIFVLLIPKRRSIITFGIGWWFISWSPRLFATVNLGWIREHHAYVPLVGLCIAFGSLFRDYKLGGIYGS